MHQGSIPRPGKYLYTLYYGHGWPALNTQGEANHTV